MERAIGFASFKSKTSSSCPMKVLDDEQKFSISTEGRPGCMNTSKGDGCSYVRTRLGNIDESS
jgi:hypothetical protein